MPKEYDRITRIGDLIKRELVVIFRQHIADPRLRFIVFTAVNVSRDLAFANVLFTQLDDPDASQKDQQGCRAALIKQLKKAAVHLRYLLAQRLELRVVPTLRFFYDDLDTRSQRLHHLIDRAVAQDEAKRSS